VSLFISGLAFDNALTDEPKIGVPTASVLAATIGLLVLRAALSTRPRAARPAGCDAVGDAQFGGEEDGASDADELADEQADHDAAGDG
jgi:Na+/H+ antiporter 1